MVSHLLLTLTDVSVGKHAQHIISKDPRMESWLSANTKASSWSSRSLLSVKELNSSLSLAMVLGGICIMS